MAGALILSAAAGAAAAAAPVRPDLPAEWKAQFDQLQYHIRKNKGWFRKAAPTTCRSDALILDADRDPADVVLRRSEALLGRLGQMLAGRDLSPERAQLEALKARAAKTPVGSAGERYALYQAACRLRRRIALANPLLDFDEILFVKRHRSRFNHMCDQFFGHHARPGGGLFVLSGPFGQAPRIRDVLAEAVVPKGRLKGRKLAGGAFLSPDLSYDGRDVLFAYAECDPKAGRGWSPQRSWHIFRAKVGGSGLEQLTDGKWNDFDPCWLPNGRIAFVSERRGGFGRCHGRAVPTYTLHTMNPDLPGDGNHAGGGIACISYHETNEWHPSVNHDGLIIYSRWDYVDRDSDIAHHPWVITPDGRDARAIHGNYPLFPNGRHDRPWMELDVRAIPGSRKYVATAAPHHGQAYGSLVLLDPDTEDDGAMAQLKRLTPEVKFPEAERGLEFYGTAWPLSEDFYLCVAGRFKQRVDRRKRLRIGADSNYGIYLLDSFGNRVLLYRDPQIGCRDPIPLRRRGAPPILPHMTDVGAAGGRPAAPQEGVVACINVYDGLKPWPEGTRITHLRIVQLYPKATPAADRPRIGIAAQSLARGALGTVPVEPDGSCHFRAPAGKAVYFQALDDRGLAVQSMRSDTWVHAGQRLTCQGCHEPRYRAPSPPRQVPLALRREPSPIRPEVKDADPVLFPRLVQPVLDRNCAACHRKHEKAPDLSGTVSGDRKRNRHGWSVSYHNLARLGHWYNGGNGAMRNPLHGRSRTTPGLFGARASRLFQMLQAGHHGVKLSSGDLRRIAIWIDCNTNFYGAYHDTAAQAAGKLVRPPLE